MARDIKKEVKLTRDLNYLNKDFPGFRKDLLNYSIINSWWIDAGTEERIKKLKKLI